MSSSSPTSPGELAPSTSPSSTPLPKGDTNRSTSRNNSKHNDSKVSSDGSSDNEGDIESVKDDGSLSPSPTMRYGSSSPSPPSPSSGNKKDKDSRLEDKVNVIADQLANLGEMFRLYIINNRNNNNNDNKSNGLPPPSSPSPSPSHSGDYNGNHGQGQPTVGNIITVANNQGGTHINHNSIMMSPSPLINNSDDTLSHSGVVTVAAPSSSLSGSSSSPHAIPPLSKGSKVNVNDKSNNNNIIYPIPFSLVGDSTSPSGGSSVAASSSPTPITAKSNIISPSSTVSNPSLISSSSSTIMTTATSKSPLTAMPPPHTSLLKNLSLLENIPSGITSDQYQLWREKLKNNLLQQPALNGIITNDINKTFENFLESYSNVYTRESIEKYYADLQQMMAAYLYSRIPLAVKNSICEHIKSKPSEYKLYHILNFKNKTLEEREDNAWAVLTLLDDQYLVRSNYRVAEIFRAWFSLRYDYKKDPTIYINEYREIHRRGALLIPEWEQFPEILKAQEIFSKLPSFMSSVRMEILNKGRDHPHTISEVEDALRHWWNTGGKDYISRSERKESANVTTSTSSSDNYRQGKGKFRDKRNNNQEGSYNYDNESSPDEHIVVTAVECPDATEEQIALADQLYNEREQEISEMAASAIGGPLGQLNPQSYEMIYDSGATCSVTGLKDRLVDIKNINPTMIGTLSGGRVVRQEGTLNIRDRLSIGHVKFMPSATHSLLSVAQMSNAKFTTVFDKDGAYTVPNKVLEKVIEEIKRKSILTAVRFQNLYLVKVYKPPVDNTPDVTVLRGNKDIKATVEKKKKEQEKYKQQKEKSKPSVSNKPYSSYKSDESILLQAEQQFNKNEKAQLSPLNDDSQEGIPYVSSSSSLSSSDHKSPSSSSVPKVSVSRNTIPRKLPFGRADGSSVRVVSTGNKGTSAKKSSSSKRQSAHSIIKGEIENEISDTAFSWVQHHELAFLLTRQGKETLERLEQLSRFGKSPIASSLGKDEEMDNDDNDNDDEDDDEDRGLLIPPSNTWQNGKQY